MEELRDLGRGSLRTSSSALSPEIAIPQTVGRSVREGRTDWEGVAPVDEGEDNRESCYVPRSEGYGSSQLESDGRGGLGARDDRIGVPRLDLARRHTFGGPGPSPARSDARCTFA